MPHNKPEIFNQQTASAMFSGTVTLEIFLRDYWQKKPLLIRQAFPELVSPLSPEELAGLACEDGVNARLVIEHDASGPWAVQYGPFDDDSFSRLPESHWTLLVNDVEKYVPEAKELFDRFRFIPDWRKDDLMISYAVDGGSVGPHLDAYDVFLIQTYGKRNWKISHQHCDRFIADIELKILAEFSADEDWILEPGDMLYLPPNLAHYGIAVGPCMTASVGFRAPSVRAMVSEFAEFIANHTAETLRYGDPDIQPQSHPAAISAAALSAVKDLLSRQLVIDDAQLAQWFGEYMTDARSSNQLAASNNEIADFETLKQRLLEQTSIQQSPFSRFLYISNETRTLLFVDGHSYHTSAEFAATLCGNHIIDADVMLAACTTEEDRNTLLNLYSKGCIE